MTTRADLQAALASPNVRAFLALIRAGEGRPGDEGYRELFGGELFDNGFADHPRRTVTKGGYTSTAAGAYQFLSRTWDGLVKQYAFPDFSPACQDEGAVALIAGRGALADVLAGRIPQAVARCAREWASLPGSPYGQPTRTLAQALATYTAAGGVLEPVAELPLVQLDQAARGVPVTQVPVQPAPTSSTDITGGFTMPPFLLAALPSLIQAIPKLAALFGSGSEVSDRNVAAVQTVAQIVQDATGAKNIQEAVEAIQSEPAMLQAATQAVQDNWFALTETGGGIEAAAKRDLEFVKSGAKLWESPAFVISLVMLLMVFMLLADVFFVHPGKEYYGEAIRTQIVTGVLAVLMIVGGFWLGSSFGSQKKTDAMTGG